MLKPLTDRQNDVLEFIKGFSFENGISPTRSEIAIGMGFRSKTAAVDHLKALERKGYIYLHSETSRGIQILQNTDELPIIGHVAAGSPIEAIENIDKTIPVPPGLFNTRPTYLLRVRGDSMIDAGILDGDLIAVQKTSKAKSGQIVVARVNDEVTVKRLEIKRNRPILLPENKDYNPILVVPGELIIEGIFVGLIRDVI
ncbi:MAG: transcriptional repressor LexA [Pseudomonadales bacterium]|nr:transcriptional repressor LexA [Pseudomonadales bacterium]